MDGYQIVSQKMKINGPPADCCEIKTGGGDIGVKSSEVLMNSMLACRVRQCGALNQAWAQMEQRGSRVRCAPGHESPLMRSLARKAFKNFAENERGRFIGGESGENGKIHENRDSNFSYAAALVATLAGSCQFFRLAESKCHSRSMTWSLEQETPKLYDRRRTCDVQELGLSITTDKKRLFARRT